MVEGFVRVGGEEERGAHRLHVYSSRVMAIPLRHPISPPCSPSFGSLDTPASLLAFERSIPAFEKSARATAGGTSKAHERPRWCADVEGRRHADVEPFAADLEDATLHRAELFTTAAEPRRRFGAHFGARVRAAAARFFAPAMVTSRPTGCSSTPVDTLHATRRPSRSPASWRAPAAPPPPCTCSRADADDREFRPRPSGAAHGGGDEARPSGASAAASARSSGTTPAGARHAAAAASEAAATTIGGNRTSLISTPAALVGSERSTHACRLYAAHSVSSSSDVAPPRHAPTRPPPSRGCCRRGADAEHDERRRRRRARLHRRRLLQAADEGEHGGGERGEPRRDGQRAHEAAYAPPRRSVLLRLAAAAQPQLRAR